MDKYAPTANPPASTAPKGRPTAWIVWATPYYGRSSHARIYREGEKYAADAALCKAQPVRWVSGRGSDVRPKNGAVCRKCDGELERLRLIHGPDYLAPPAAEATI